MLKKLFAISFALMLSTSYMNTTQAADKECAFVSVQYLLEVNKDKIVKLHTVEGEKFEKYLSKVNTLRAKNGYLPIVSVGMLIAEFKNGKIGTALIDAQGCVLYGTLSAGSLAEIKEVFKEVDSVDLLDIVGSTDG